jgi:hypothetical protein
VKKRAHFITEGERGAGVAEIVERMIRNDLAELCQLRA